MPASSVAASRRRFGVGRALKRWLYIVHRWIGIATCALFAIWFISGLVMIYVPFPGLTMAERISGSPAIAFERVRVQPAAAARTAGVPSPRSIVLEMAADAPVWRIRDWDGGEQAVSASAGHLLGPVAAAQAARVAAAFGQAPAAGVATLERDQWTVAGSFDRHRPLWKVDLAGPGGRVLYVSSRTGAVVLDTNSRERFWNWIGSVPHWIYPTVLRQDGAAWRQVVLWVSGPCILVAVTGMWIGMLRVRIGRRRFGGARMTPYRGAMAWHHVTGLVGGLALLGWIFSGWLSVDPFRLFASPGVGIREMQAYAAARVIPPIDLPGLAARAPGARHIEISWVAGQPLLLIPSPDRPTVALDADGLAPATVSEERMIAMARRLVPGARLRSVERLTQPDAYWYAAKGPSILPVLRLRFDDPARTWVHLDPATGRFLGDLDSRRRVYRWAFDLLHKWDLNMLTLHRPLWDAVVWLLSALGLVSSITGIWIGWKRLTRPSRPRPGSGGSYTTAGVGEP